VVNLSLSMSKMVLKLYYDLLSQPSRALYITLTAANIPFEKCEVALRNGVHMSEEYKRDVSRFGKVPVIHDGDFKLTESVAILRYLSREKNLSENFYPKESKAQARVDEFLEWQHNNVRAFCAMYFQKKWLIPILTGKPITEEKLKTFKDNMETCLDSMETLWLASTPYIAGKTMTAADIWAACEIEQPRMAGYDPLIGRPVLAAWMERVRKDLDPVYGEAHAILNKIAAKNKTFEHKL